MAWRRKPVLAAVLVPPQYFIMPESVALETWRKDCSPPESIINWHHGWTGWDEGDLTEWQDRWDLITGALA